MEKELNKEQLEAVEHKSGPMLVVAGAGTGKTKVITERIKWLIGTNLARPEEILALTFTEKAAREMEERVDVALPYGTFGLWISTFHSFCDRILKQEALHIGLSPAFKLMTEAEAFLFVKNNFWGFDLKYFRPSGNPYKFIEGMIQHFSRLKDEDIVPKDYKNDEFPELVAAYKIYEDLKAAEGVMDFSDLIEKTLTLFRTRPAILSQYQKQFKYILVDEFQDTNFAQNELLKLISGEAANIMVVADDDQSIYRFRGAAVSNVIQFRDTYPKAKVVTLIKNYRSTQEILDNAYNLIQKNNPDRLEVKEKIDKKLIAFGENKKYSQEKIEMVYADRVEDEAEMVVAKIRELKKEKKYDFKDFAILVRANNHSEPFVRALERAKIPYQFLGPGMLFRQPEIRDLIAYLHVLADFTDSVSLYRVLSMDVWGISQRDLIFYLNTAKKVNKSLFEQLESESDERVKKFVAMAHRHQELIPKETAGQILFYFLEDSGLLREVVEYKTAGDERRALNIMKFFDKMKGFEAVNSEATVFAAKDYLDLAMEMGESPLAAETDWSENDAVSILTVHSAKGLEFPVVFLVNLVEGRFPSRERKEQIPIPDNLIKEVLPEGDFHQEEERRLFYVGMTRAKERLIFSAASYYGEGKRERKLSPFVYEALGSSFVPPSGTSAGKEKQLPLFEWSKPKEILDETLPKTRVDYLSYSAIENFRTCPLHYKLKNILRIPTPYTAAQAMGNSIHLALRDFYQVGNSETLVNLLEKNWVQEGYSSRRHEEEAMVKAKRFLEEYLKSDIHAQAKPILLEKPFYFWLGKDLKIGGKMDRVDDLGKGVVEIVDYKTGANVPTQKDIDTDLQMTIYVLAATDQGISGEISKLTGQKISEVRLAFYYFDNGKRVVTKRSGEELEKAKKDLLEIKKEIESSDFLCSHSKLCENCEFKMLCN